MSRFYIKQISAYGAGRTPSTIPFEDGVNIIHGASNSGKSYVISCINFMFGGDIPFTKDSTGYDTISMILKSNDGESVSITRKIVDGEKGDRGASTVQVVTSLSNFESGDYNIAKLEYSDLLLYLIGIKERHKIISSQDFKIQNLTIRTIFHLFFVDEDNIFEKGTTIDVPKHSKITASICALKFLFDGDDMNELVPDVTKEERELRGAKNNAVIIYINEKIQQLTERRGELEASLSGYGDEDIDDIMNSIIEEISSVENEIVEASNKNRKVLEEKYAISAKLEEATFLKDRYIALRSQYTSDIKRLKFIADGDAKRSVNRKPTHCPFCDGNIPQQVDIQEKYIDASTAEMRRINMQLKDLVEAENDLDNQLLMLETRKKDLDAYSDVIATLINGKLKPKATELKNSLASFKRVSQIQHEMSAVETIASGLGTDAFNRSLDDDDKIQKIDPRTKIDKQLWETWSDEFDAAVKACAYPNATNAYISIDTVDAVVNGKQKRNEGKGYRAFLNTIMTFTLMKFLEAHGTYAPGILILDSPILSLKEKVKPQEHATAGMKESLFKFVIDNCGNNQIIIAENELPTSEIVDYKKANMIEFTLDESEGRYGFLLDVRDIENK